MKNILISIILLVGMTSCTHYYYIPTTANVPLFKEKNEYRATVSLGTGDETTTADIQAAYSFTNQFAVMTNIMLAWGGENNSNNSGKGQCIEAAVGYFKPLGMNGVFEIYGGLGGSKQQHYYINGGSANLSFTKVFIQPSIGLTFNNVEIALTSGLSNINFNNIHNQIAPGSREYLSVEQISKNKNSILYEPYLTLRGGSKNVKLQFQFGLSSNLTNTDLGFEIFKLSGGLTFSFGQRFKTKNTETQSY